MEAAPGPAFIYISRSFSPQPIQAAPQLSHLHFRSWSAHIFLPGGGPRLAPSRSPVPLPRDCTPRLPAEEMLHTSVPILTQGCCLILLQHKEIRPCHMQIGASKQLCAGEGVAMVGRQRGGRRLRRGTGVGTWGGWGQ